MRVSATSSIAKEKLMRTNFVCLLALTVLALGCSTESSVVGAFSAVDASNGKNDTQLVESDAAVEVEETAIAATVCEDGAACSDIAHCILHGQCHDGQCVANTNPCEDGNVCTDDSCDPNSGCTYTWNSVTCSDNNACTDGDHCGGGACVADATVACDDGNVCTQDYCGALEGCIHEAKQNPCDDGNYCSANDVCVGSVCAAGKPINCSDDNACTLDTCDPVAGCTFKNKDCDDKKVWTTDWCSDGGCSHNEYRLLVSPDINYNPPGNKPPVSMVPVFFVGNAYKKTFNPNDAWTPYSLIDSNIGFSLEGYCTDPQNVFVDKPHWNAGYVLHVNGLEKDHLMLGGHTVKLLIVTVLNSFSVLAYDGEQPKLLPLSGKQEYDAGGKPIPESYYSPNLKSICDKLIAEQAAFDKKK